MASNNAPGPKGNVILGSIQDYMKSPLRFMIKTAQDYGDVAYYRLGPYRFYLLSHPDHIYEMLVKQANKFHKPGLTRRLLGQFMGEGLFVAVGELHRQQRKLAQPAFHQKRIDSYAQAMVDYSYQMRDAWQPGQAIDVEPEMRRLTLQIVAKTLFNSEMSDATAKLSRAVNALQEVVSREFRVPLPLPSWIPIAHNVKKKQAIKDLDSIVLATIAQHRQAKADNGDLLSMLVLAVDEENGKRMDDQQLRDEVTTLFLAGHETTANSLIWAFYLLSQHPDIWLKLTAEVDSVLGSRRPTLEDLAQLKYTSMIIKETLRLYPPIYYLDRTPLEDVTIGDYTFKKGSILACCPFITHHDERYFEKPDEFNPERFADGWDKKLPRFAYFPFGGGPRVCIGQQFALMEATFILACIAQRYELSLAPGHEVVIEDVLTIRPKYGMRMTITERQPKALAVS
jgi:cytochrome P450